MITEVAWTKYISGNLLKILLKPFSFHHCSYLYLNPWELTWRHICSVNHPLSHICSQVSSLSPPNYLSKMLSTPYLLRSPAQNSFHVFSSVLQKNMNCVWPAMPHTTEPILVPTCSIFFLPPPHLLSFLQISQLLSLMYLSFLSSLPHMLSFQLSPWLARISLVLRLPILHPVILLPC